MRDPPDKTTVKDPLSLVNFSERSAVYLAKLTAKSSLVSKTSTFLWAAIEGDEDALQTRFSRVKETAFKVREREGVAVVVGGSSESEAAWTEREYGKWEDRIRSEVGRDKEEEAMRKSAGKDL